MVQLGLSKRQIGSVPFARRSGADVSVRPLKNRIGENLPSFSRLRTARSMPQSLGSTSETTVAVTITASVCADWPARDPIGDHSAYLRIAQRRSKKDIRVLLWASRSPAYLFLNNSPVNLADFLGLYGPGSFKEKCCVWWALKGTGVGTAYLIHDLAGRMGDAAGGDVANAIRHCTAGCMLTAAFGSDRALAVLECHEKAGEGVFGSDTDVDRYNNAKGIELGSTSPPPSPDDCLDGCLRALDDGELNQQ